MNTAETRKASEVFVVDLALYVSKKTARRKLVDRATGVVIAEAAVDVSAQSKGLRRQRNRGESSGPVVVKEHCHGLAEIAMRSHGLISRTEQHCHRLMEKVMDSHHLIQRVEQRRHQLTEAFVADSQHHCGLIPPVWPRRVSLSAVKWVWLHQGIRYNAGNSLSANASIQLTGAEPLGFCGFVFCLGGYTLQHNLKTCRILTGIECVATISGFLSITGIQLPEHLMPWVTLALFMISISAPLFVLRK
ncbi:hypothetical protein OWV82_006960 [Melia azedarach]|uniref:Uncharacterized protein n=1 Tax=Melia azedarach TaxID=155640 RepID=A0ACC1YKF7_MELAZ|nr:hypothetical protein OWV82_006960 [Melia azedarach]